MFTIWWSIHRSTLIHMHKPSYTSTCTAEQQSLYIVFLCLTFAGQSRLKCWTEKHSKQQSTYNFMNISYFIFIEKVSLSLAYSRINVCQCIRTNMYGQSNLMAVVCVSGWLTVSVCLFISEQMYRKRDWIKISVHGLCVCVIHSVYNMDRWSRFNMFPFEQFHSVWIVRRFTNVSNESRSSESISFHFDSRFYAIDTQNLLNITKDSNVRRNWSNSTRYKVGKIQWKTIPISPIIQLEQRD